MGRRACKPKKVCAKGKAKYSKACIPQRAVGSLLLSSLPKVGMKRLKYVDFQLDAYTATNNINDEYSLLVDPDNTAAGIALGNTINTRIGSRIHVKRIEFQFASKISETRWDETAFSLHDNQHQRIVLYADRKHNQSASVSPISDVLDHTTAFEGTGFPNMEWRGRFKILFDKHKQWNAGSQVYHRSTATTGDFVNTPGSIHNINGAIDCDIVVNYNETDTTGGITKFDQDIVACVLKTPNGAANAPIQEHHLTWRVYFTD